MNRRTPDHVKCASQKFFEDQSLSDAVLKYFEGSCVQEKLAEGYLKYQHAIEEAKEYAPEGAEFLEKVMEKYSMTKQTYDQETFKTFKGMLAAIMSPAAVFIPINELVVILLQDQEDANLMMLVESAMEDIFEYMIPRMNNLITLLSDGIPIEKAQEIAEAVGEAEIIPVQIEICYENNDEDEDSHNHECCGECGGRCDCEEKEECDKTGHCQYE